MQVRQVISVVVALITLVSATALGIGVPMEGDATDVQETTVETTTPPETTPTDSQATEVSNLFVEEMTLENVTARNVTVRRMLLPTGETVTNATFDQVLVTGTLRSVTFENITLRDTQLAQRVGPAGEYMEQLAIRNRVIEGIVLENATIFNSNFVRLVSQQQGEPNETAEAPAVEVGQAFAENAFIREVIVGERNVTTPTPQFETATPAAETTTPAVETTTTPAAETTTTPPFETTTTPAFETTTPAVETTTENATA